MNFLRLIEHRSIVLFNFGSCRYLKSKWNNSIDLEKKINFFNPKRFFTDDQKRRQSSIVQIELPLKIITRSKNLKFSFGYTNYSHRRHIRPPGHHLVNYFQFFLILIGSYGIFYFINLTEFEDRWSQPINVNLTHDLPMNSFNENEEKQRLQLFSHVKALNKQENQIKTSSENIQFVDEFQSKIEKKKISFRDKKKIAYENRLRSYSTPDKIFRYFATIKLYNDENPDGLICMTPSDFLRSITPGLKQPDGFELDKYFRYDSRIDSKEELKKFDLKNEKKKTIFEKIGGEFCLITFSDFVFLLTILSTPRRYFQIAFQMFDLDGNGNFDFDEFRKLKNLIRSQTSIGQRHRDHSTTGNILKENSILNQYFFGENLDQMLTLEKFLEFYEELQNEILILEFNHLKLNSIKFDENDQRISELDFARSLLSYSGLNEKQMKKMLNRIKKIYSNSNSNPSEGISFEDYQNFHNFLRNIHDIDTALTFYHIVGGSIDKQIFHHVAKIVNQIDLNQHLIDVVFHLFDENQDQLLSYLEFIQIMKNRLERGLQKPKDTSFIKFFSTILQCTQQTFFEN